MKPMYYPDPVRNVYSLEFVFLFPGMGCCNLRIILDCGIIFDRRRRTANTLKLKRHCGLRGSAQVKEYSSSYASVTTGTHRLLLWKLHRPVEPVHPNTMVAQSCRALLDSELTECCDFKIFTKELGDRHLENTDCPVLSD